MVTMKILFLEIDTEQTWALASVGPGYIASHIRLHVHEAAFMRVRLRQTIPEIVEGIKKEAPDIVGFSLTSRQWKRAAYVAGGIHKHLKIPVIAGGLFPTFVPEIVLQSKSFDCVCLCEGEAPVNDLLSHLEKGKDISSCRVPNIWVEGADRPQIRPPLDPLDKMPFMARDLLDEQHGVIHINTGRGCPFECTFCLAGAICGLYENEKYLRKRSTENVVEELRRIKDNSVCNYVIFWMTPLQQTSAG